LDVYHKNRGSVVLRRSSAFSRSVAKKLQPSGLGALSERGANEASDVRKGSRADLGTLTNPQVEFRRFFLVIATLQGFAPIFVCLENLDFWHAARRGGQVLNYLDR
jgi:hypothetical protein